MKKLKILSLMLIGTMLISSCEVQHHHGRRGPGKPNKEHRGGGERRRH